MKLISPHPFPERLLLYGGAGSGKTTSALSIAQHIASDVYVVESDYSASYMRGLALEYHDAVDRVHVYPVSDWPEFIKAVTRVVEMADVAAGDWIVIDSSTPSYSWVQDWTVEQALGSDIAGALMELRRTAKNAQEYAGQRLKLLPWEIAKKEYNKLWRTVQRWQGNMVMTAEAKEIGYWDRDDSQTKRIYGPIGAYPAGQDTVRYAMSTTLFLENPRHGQWEMTTIKDRNREVQDREPVSNFALDYLVGVAGWGKA